MGGKARIANTTEEIQPGKVLINGTAHKIKQGKTRINGTIRNITFEETGSATPGDTWDFTSNGTFTVPCTGYYDIEIHGGGGGGGYGTTWSTSTSGGGQSGSGGGGSGNLLEGIYLIYNHTYYITIGVAGKGGDNRYTYNGAEQIAPTDGGKTTITPSGPNAGSTFKNTELAGGGAGGSGGSYTQSYPEDNQVLDNNVGNLSTGGIIGKGGFNYQGGASYSWSGSGAGGSGGCTFGSYGDGGDGSTEQFTTSNNKGQDGKAGAVRIKFIRRG